ncbi:MAG TPA: solute carrier family 23 protein [Burkholderiales bacterium]|nr:solute carrier family 23 protein [Burkholderiales bacterium]
MKKPPHIIYAVDDRPPLTVTLLSGLQHVGIIAIALVYPLLLGREAGLSVDRISDVLAATMLILGLGAVLQSLPRGPLGAGFLCPPVCTAAYLGPSLLAVKTGGVSLAFGMLAFAGVIETALSRLLRPLRPYLPPEISGLVVVLIAVALGSLAFRSLLGVGMPQAEHLPHFVVAAVTLGTMVGLSVWSRGIPRLFCALIGMAVGYAAAVANGALSATDLQTVRAAPLLSPPGFAAQGWAWDASLVLPFAVAALANCVRTIGDVTICQKINDADWVRPDMRSISGGALANGVTNVVGGMLGAHGVSTYTSSVGLAAATGVASRQVGYAIGGIFVLLAFMPKASAMFLVMPAPVIGAATLFTSAIIFINGLQIITSRLLDARRTFVIGLAFMAAMAVELHASFFGGLPAATQVFFGSSLVLGTVTALLLNLVFRLGVRKTQRLLVDPRRLDPAAIEAFMETQGAAWGARRDVIDRAGFDLAQSIETIVDSGVASGPLEIEASFDEFSLDLRVSYDGPPLELPEARPSNEEIMASEEGAHRLAGFLLRRHADRVQATTRAGRSTILFHFDH